MRTIGFMVLAAALAFGPAAQARKARGGFHPRAIHMSKPRMHFAGSRSVRIRHANGHTETCRRSPEGAADITCR